MIRTTFYRFRRLLRLIHTREPELTGPRARTTIKLYGTEAKL